jgi:hypothetical protein
VTGFQVAITLSQPLSWPRGAQEEMARLVPFVSSRLGVHGSYSFVLPTSPRCHPRTAPP